MQELKDWVQLMRLYNQWWIIYPFDTNCPCQLCSFPPDAAPYLAYWPIRWLFSAANYAFMILLTGRRILIMLIWHVVIVACISFQLSPSLFFFPPQRWSSWWLQQRPEETWLISHLEMLSSWETSMKCTLSSPRGESPLVRCARTIRCVCDAVVAAVTHTDIAVSSSCSILHNEQERWWYQPRFRLWGSWGSCSYPWCRHYRGQHA